MDKDFHGYFFGLIGNWEPEYKCYQPLMFIDGESIPYTGGIRKKDLINWVY